MRVHEYPDGSLAIFDGPRCLVRFDPQGRADDVASRSSSNNSSGQLICCKLRTSLRATDSMARVLESPSVNMGLWFY
jgi:hypothetical protein